MSDVAYNNAIKRRDELRRELDEVEQFLQLWKRYAGTKPDQTEWPLAGKDQNSGKVTAIPELIGTRRYTKPAAIPKIVRRILQEKGRPMTRTSLVNSLNEGDVFLKGADQPRYLGTILWRFRDQFVNIEGEGYWPRDIPCAEVDYTPPPPPPPPKPPVNSS